MDFCLQNRFTLRFVETMPVGDAGQSARERYVNLSEVQKLLERRFKLEPASMTGAGPAKYLKVVGEQLTIGLITPMSQHFCDTCNRVRLSVDGSIYLCLGQNDVVPLRHQLRTGISDNELTQSIYNAIQRKPLKHDFNDSPHQVVRFMAHTGG